MTPPLDIVFYKIKHKTDENLKTFVGYAENFMSKKYDLFTKLKFNPTSNNLYIYINENGGADYWKIFRIGFGYFHNYEEVMERLEEYKAKEKDLIELKKHRRPRIKNKKGAKPNCEALRNRVKEWREDYKKIHGISYNKMYYNRIKKQITCECGAKILNWAYRHHVKTKKHKEALKANESI